MTLFLIIIGAWCGDTVSPRVKVSVWYRRLVAAHHQLQMCLQQVLGLYRAPKWGHFTPKI